MKFIGIKPSVNWKLQSQSELILIIFNMELTHLGYEASNCYVNSLIKT